MSQTEHLYQIDYSLFTPENLRPLFEEEKARVLADLEYLTTKEELSIDDVFGQRAYNIDLESELRYSPMFHLASVADTEEFRSAFAELVEDRTKLHLEVMQNEKLYQAYKKLYDNNQDKLTTEQKSALKEILLNYELSGIALPADKKEEFARLSQELSLASLKFSNNALDSRQAWKKLITDKSELEGLPETALETLQANAKQEGYEEGYLLTLDIPVLLQVMKNCKNRELRKEISTANNQIASPEDASGGKYDNTDVVNQIVALHNEQAKLLGFKSFAHLSLENKMAESPEQVLDFLTDLRDKSLAKAKAEYKLIEEYAKSKDPDLDTLEPWDVAYYSTQYIKEKLAVDSEEVRKYFPEDKVFAGLFEVLNRLYGLTFEVDESVKTYHPDVKFFKCYENGKLIAGLYTDLYVRKGKRSGAWMSQAFSRFSTPTDLKLPVAYITCNFTAPVNGKSALLTMDEVNTLFHEMGHALHLLLTKTAVANICGTNVEWDAVELPSQITENWCRHPDALQVVSSHIETGKPMSKDFIESLQAVEKFEKSGMFITRQLEFGIFDMLLYSKDESDKRKAIELFDDVREEISKKVTGKKYPTYFANSFGHIFAGGYSAGYYSYLWAEVLAADAFEAFEETGDIFNREVATKFKNNVLAVGGTYPSMISYENFRGRKPETDALLKAYDLVQA